MTRPGEVEEEFGVPIPGAIVPEDQWAKTALKRWPPPPLDWEAVFNRSAPVVLDLGCGNGRYTLLSALRRPDWNHFGLDVLPVVIRYATRRANQRGLHNVRFGVKDAQTFIAEFVTAASVAEVHLYHPQPFHDPRKAHLRLLTPRFLADVHRALEPGGLFATQTDNPDYWAYMIRVLPCFFTFEAHEAPWPDAPAGRTRREILAMGRHLRVFRGTGRRREDVSVEAAAALAESLPPPSFRSRGPWCELDALDGGDATGPRRGRRSERRGR